MLRLFRLLVCLCLAGLLGACLGPVPKIDVNQAALAKINTITVIRPPERKQYTVLNIGHPGMMFGLVGGLIAAADMNTKMDQLTTEMKKQNLAVPAVLTDRLVAGLGKEGYKVAASDAPWEEKEGKITLQYENIQSDSDAVLVVLPTIVGFVSGGPMNGSNDYLPTIALVTTLLDRDHKTILYRGYHVTGWQLKAEGWRHTPATARFPDFSDLMAKPSDTAASLVTAGDLVTQTVAVDLRRTPAAAPPAAQSAPAPGTAAK